MFKLPAWSEKSNLFIAVRLQVGRVFDQTVVEAAVVALVEALATGFVHKRHEVHLKTAEEANSFIQFKLRVRLDIYEAGFMCVLQQVYIHICLTFSFICGKACTCFHTELGYLWYFSIIFYWIRVLLSNQCLHWFSTEYGWMMFSFWNIWMDYRDKIRQYY